MGARKFPASRLEDPRVERSRVSFLFILANKFTYEVPNTYLANLFKHLKIHDHFEGIIWSLVLAVLKVPHYFSLFPERTCRRLAWAGGLSIQ